VIEFRQTIFFKSVYYIEMPSKWIEFVKDWASKHNVSYSSALKNADMKAEYHKAEHLPDRIKRGEVYKKQNVKGGRLPRESPRPPPPPPPRQQLPEQVLRQIENEFNTYIINNNQRGINYLDWDERVVSRAIDNIQRVVIGADRNEVIVNMANDIITSMFWNFYNADDEIDITADEDDDLGQRRQLREGWIRLRAERR